MLLHGWFIIYLSFYLVDYVYRYAMDSNLGHISSYNK